ncbi:MAG: pyrimidine/purine nucleoside phosphorylase [Desulfovibrionaceae bacterium]
MSAFTNVTVTREANIYFDGKVTSRALTFADGTVKTLGIMLPGDYEFGTQKAEVMEIQAGEMTVLLPGETAWRTVRGGESFNVPANASFKLHVATVVDYCCSYIDA